MNGKKLKLATMTVCVALAIVAIYAALRVRPAIKLEYDAAYWPEKTVHTGDWYFCITPAGITYNLYIPPAMDREDAKPSIPLIVVFHGSTGKATAKDRFGRLFTDAKAQQKLDPNGAAVLVLQSRVEYFSDPHSYARLIKNIVMEHRCIDKERIAGYGFSQGAAFVHELSMYEPGLFRAAVTGSSYYAASPWQLLRASRVRFYCALSRNDQGIYEQGVGTARALAAICPKSRYVEYETRGHFHVEMPDKTGHGNETFVDWLASALGQ